MRRPCACPACQFDRAERERTRARRVADARREAAKLAARRVLDTRPTSHPAAPASLLNRTDPDMDPYSRTFDRYVRASLAAARTAPRFPASVKAGATVRLKHRQREQFVEFVVGAVTQSAVTGETIAVAVKGHGSEKFEAASWALEKVLKAAPAPLPTKPGVYIPAGVQDRYNAGQAVEVFQLLPSGGWTQRFGAGVTHARTASEVSSFVGSGSLVRLTA